MGKDRDYFYKKAKRTRNEDDWIIAKYLRNITNKRFKQAKAEYIKEQLENNSDNSSKFWRTIKSVFPSRQGEKTNNKISLQDQNGIRVEETDTANYINEFFVNVGKDKSTKQNKSRMRNKVAAVSHNRSVSQSLKECSENSFGEDLTLEESEINFKDPIKLDEVIKLLRQINISKSSGMDNISSRLIRDALLALFKEFTHLLNLSLAEGIFPNKWKSATVTPIPKAGDQKQVSNLRPISFIPLPGKIMEKLIHNQLINHIDNLQWLSELQFGFRKGKSTLQAIHTLTEVVNSGFNKSQITAAVYVDFKKAFDCVQYPQLLNKIEELDISNQAFAWIKDYLTNRKQRTLANGILSDYLPVTQGVPQGSILGPLLYIIYANDISNIFTRCKSVFYSDDTVLFIQGNNLGELETAIQEDLDKLQSWCNDNKIFVNAKKTKYMLFGSKNKLSVTSDLNISIGQTKLERANSYTYLGVTLIIKRVSDKLYQLNKIRYCLNTKAALLIYKNMILPIMEYGDVFAVSTTLEIRKKLQKLQNRGLKIEHGKDKLYNTNKLHEEAKLDKLKWRRKQHLGRLMFHATRQKSFQNWTKKKHAMRTRSSKKKQIQTKKTNNEKYKKV